MNTWATKIQPNQLYHCMDKQLTIADVVSSKMSKLSLFSCESAKQQIEAFFQLTSDFTDSFQFQFCDAVQDGYWEIFAPYAALKAWSRRNLANSCFDYLLWPQGLLEPPQLLLFDMDSTFIEIEVIDELARRHGVGDEVAAVTESAMRGELDFAESLVSRVACIKGLSAKVIDDIAASLPISKGIPRLVSASHKNGTSVAIVSGGFSPFVEKLKMDLALFQVKANNLEVKEGRLTGVIEGAIVDAAAKAEFLNQLCNSLSIPLSRAMAIGDGANDLLMMQAAGFNLAYQAKPKVEAEANGSIKRTNLGRLADIFAWHQK